MTGASSFRCGGGERRFKDTIEGEDGGWSCGLGGLAAVGGVGAENDPIDRFTDAAWVFTVR